MNIDVQIKLGWIVKNLCKILQKILKKQFSQICMNLLLHPKAIKIRRIKAIVVFLAKQKNYGLVFVMQ